MSDASETEVEQPVTANVTWPWRKGMPSPNPGGRPRAQHRLQELAREHTEKAIAKLCAIMDDPESPSSTQVAAAEALLDRGWGRPAQTIHTPDVPVWEQPVNTLELARRIAFILETAKRELDAQPESAALEHAAADAEERQ